MTGENVNGLRVEYLGEGKQRMPKVWGLTQSTNFWTSFFSTTDLAQRKMPLLWTCCDDQAKENLLRKKAQIYDPFVGIAHPLRMATCLGVLTTLGYESPPGYTVELLPMELIPNPIPIATLVAACALPEEASTCLAGHGFLQAMEPSNWTSFKNVLSETNPLLVSSLATVENWHHRRKYLDHVLEIIAQRGCTEDEEQEVFSALRTLTRTAPENQVFSGPLALQTCLRVALKAQLLPAKEWEKLWKDLADAWYGYVMTLTPQEVTQLTDLNQTFDL
jgi:hypothetical protein